MKRRLEKLFDSDIRPSLAAHGGFVEIVDIDNGVVYVKLGGGCQGCSSSSATLKDGIEKLVKKHYPELSQVVDLTDHNKGDNPYYD